VSATAIANELKQSESVDRHTSEKYANHLAFMGFWATIILGVVLALYAGNTHTSTDA
jgi:hypothetical protein